jgi:phage shock protein A
MDDVLRRLGLIESAVAQLRGEVRYLATKADLEALRADSSALETRLVKAIADGDAKLAATIAEGNAKLAGAIADGDAKLAGAIADGDAKLAATIAALDTRLSSAMASLEGRIIKWLVGTMLASVGAAAAVAKLLV